jgi:regulator of protease activity HflC (stomatin/prohibitin superfamily)
MGGLVVLLVIFFILAVILLVTSVKIVNQSETMVIERLGKFDRVLDSGLNIIYPIIEKPRKINWKYTENRNGKEIVRRIKKKEIDLRETVYDFPKQSVITKDNVGIDINAMIYFQVTGPKKAVYEINDLPNAIENLTQTTLRNVIGEMELDETLSSRDTINKKLRKILDEATDKWGVKVNRVELQDIIPPKDIKNAMEKQMRAERDRRASILKAEGKKKSAILKAEGEQESDVKRAEGKKKARILRAEAEQQEKIKVAEGEANAIQQVSKALEGMGGDPTQYLIATKYIDKLDEITSGNNTKTVFLPYEATVVLGSLGGIKEMFSDVSGTDLPAIGTDEDTDEGEEIAPEVKQQLQEEYGAELDDLDLNI